MEWIRTLGAVFFYMTISLIAIRLWIALCDGMKQGFDKLNPFHKKKTIRWHTLNQNTVKVENELKQKIETIDDDHRIY